MYTLKQLLKNKVKLNIKNQSTFYQKFYAMTVWVQYLQPSTFCLQAKRNNQLIFELCMLLSYAYVMLLSYAYTIAERSLSR